MDKIPVDIQEWAQDQKTFALFKQREGGNPILKLLQVGKANRQVSPIQAAGITYLRGQARKRGKAWAWLEHHCDLVEDLQLTCGWPENSRVQFVNALKLWEINEGQKNRALLSAFKSAKEGDNA